MLLVYINANANNDAITLTTAGTVTGDADIGTYSLVEGSGFSYVALVILNYL